MTATSSTEPTIHRGLEGVYVATSRLGKVEGTIGRLSYMGYDARELAQHTLFEEVLYLLWHGELPSRQQLQQLQEKLHKARTLPENVMQVIRDLPTTGAPIDALRVGVTAIGMQDPTENEITRDAILEKATVLAAAMPTILAAYVRLRDGQEPVAPDDSLDAAANFLYMLHGKKQSDLDNRAFNAYLVLLAEHGLNASTFAARVTLSALSDLYSAIASALATLKGVAHGGANMAAMNMLLDIGSEANVEPYIEESLRTKRRLMGLGHRIYKTRDPRVDVLMGFSKQIAEERNDSKWHDTAKRLETITNEHPFFVERKLFPNVEFYSAPLLYELGLKPDVMPGAFGISRIAGWSAHMLEQVEDNRLIRPSVQYVGPEPRPFKSMDERG